MGKLRMRVVLIIHFKSFQMRQQKLRSFLYHHLPCGYLFRITAFTKEFIIEIEKLFGTKLFKTIAE